MVSKTEYYGLPESLLEKLEAKIIEYWHLSRVALAGQDDQGRYARMMVVKNDLKKHDAELVAGISNKKLWFLIEETTSPVKYD